MSAQRPSWQMPEQHAPPFVQASPSVPHAARSAATQNPGDALQAPLQQSDDAVHATPSAPQTPAQARAPSPPVHDPEQHSASFPHGAVRGRHVPGADGPGSQRSSTQPKQQGCPPPDEQSSPEARQRMTASTRHRPSSHAPEQQSDGAAHDSPTCTQARSEQRPPRHPPLQHS